MSAGWISISSVVSVSDMAQASTAVYTRHTIHKNIDILRSSPRDTVFKVCFYFISVKTHHYHTMKKGLIRVPKSCYINCDAKGSLGFTMDYYTHQVFSFQSFLWGC